MKRRTKLFLLVGALSVLVGIRIALPYGLEYALNHRVLADLGEYEGHVADVDLALWRGGMHLEGLRVTKVTGVDEVDFLRVPAVEIAISRRALAAGEVRLRVTLEGPEVNFVDAEEPEKRQSGAGFNWQIIPKDMLKLSLERVEMHDGAIAFRNFTSDPPVNVRVTNIDFVATNISNIEGKPGELVASAEVTADVFAESPLSAKAQFNPLDVRNFIFALDVDVKDLTKLNDFARAYANLDFARGHGTFTMELTADEGSLDGYLKPAFENVEIMDWEQDVEQQGDNPLRLLWEGFTGLVSALFSNPETDKLATRVTIEGELPEGADVNVWSAVWGIVRNAFAEALNTNFDHTTPLAVPDAGTDTSPTEDDEDE